MRCKEEHADSLLLLHVSCWLCHRFSSQKFYPQLCAFAAAHGTARVPATGATNELARWAQDQRVRRKQRKLAADKAALLEQLPGWEWLE